jgi:hypothetical protein
MPRQRPRFIGEAFSFLIEPFSRSGFEAILGFVGISGRSFQFGRTSRQNAAVDGRRKRLGFPQVFSTRTRHPATVR